MYQKKLQRHTHIRIHAKYVEKKGKKKVQGMPQSQAAALTRRQEDKKTDKTKQALIE